MDLLPLSPARGWVRLWLVCALGIVLLALSGCGGEAQPTPTRTPVPTYTATPPGAQPVAVAAAPVTTDAESQPAPTPIPPELPTETPTPEPPTATPTPEPPTDTPTPEPPTETPTPSATFTPTATATPTPTPDYAFVLEASEQFPIEGADQNEVRIYLYVYSQDNYALQDYSLSVVKDGAPLAVQARSTGGLPGETRPGPSLYTRFANLGAAFFEPPIGVWEVQLVDETGEIAGPPVQFVLGENDPQRELYVRYRRK